MKKLALLAAAALSAIGSLRAAPVRGALRIGCSPDAPAFVKAEVKRIADAADRCAVLKSLRNGGEVRSGEISVTEKPEELAYSHLVTVGLPDDPLVKKAQRFIAKFDRGGVYVFGFGAFSGDVGYVESGANPFLHSERIPSVPFETELVTITGTSPAGIRSAVDAFLRDNLVNGVVAAKGAWKRTETTILDREPAVPGEIPATGFRPPAGWTLLGVSDCPSDVRLSASDTTREVVERAILEKFTRPGELDGAGNANAFRHYLNGLDHHAYCNAAMTLFFKTEAAAANAARILDGNNRIKESRKPNAEDGKLPPVAIQLDGTRVHMTNLRK